ncbi:MAG: hypothetical protein DMD59_05255 [Gemmatimonadetes bacterium]|nr:MAG: hypothetical protein DMD59_05255 [Gemmatimonadota bacterium]
MASVLVLGAAVLVSDRLVAPNWIAWVAFVAASVALLVPLTLAVGLPAPDRQRVVSRVREIWRGVGGFRRG